MITVVGEALIDVVRAPDGTVQAHVGGSPANVAVGLARLGGVVALATRFGNDAYGDSIERHLAANDVRLLGAPRDGSETSVAEATVDDSGVATYDFRLHWELGDEARHVPAGTRCLHTGSVAATLPPGAGTVRAMLDAARSHVTISYDPNCRPSLMGTPDDARPAIEALVSASDVVKVSDEDLAWLYAGQPVEDVAAGWLTLGPSLVVVTRGGAGPWGVTAAGWTKRPAVAVEVVDTVGAGDAFMAGLLDGLRRRDLIGRDRAAALAAMPVQTVAAVLDEAAVVAAITCSRPGADPPTRAEVAAFTGA